MAIIKEKGTIAYLSEVQSGVSQSGNAWARQTIVVDVEGYNGTFRKVALQASGNIVEELKGVTAGTKVEVKTIIKEEAPKKKLIPELPSKWNSQVVMLGKLGLVCWLATLMAKIPVPVIGNISGLVWGLILGIIFTSIGFLDENILTKANSYGIVMFALLMYMFNGLKDCTPAMLSNILFPMFALIVVGVVGMAIVVFFAAKLLKLSFPMAMATALTALYGFPANAIITETTCNNLTDDADERAYLMGRMFAPMIVGGFTTVTITSVIIAGFFVGLL